MTLGKRNTGGYLMANRRTVKKHAVKRLKSRAGVKTGYKGAEEIAKEVLEKGTRIVDLEEGALKDFLCMRYKSNNQRKRTYLYGGDLFIFDKRKILITTYPFQVSPYYQKLLKESKKDD